MTIKRTLIFLIPATAILTLLVMASIFKWMGYIPLSRYLLYGTINTTIVLIAACLLHTTATFLLIKIETGNRPWQEKWRNSLGLKKNGRVIEILMLRAIFYLLIWGTFILFLLKEWGLTQVNFENLSDLIKHGFLFGNLTIVPMRILSGTLVFIILSLFTRHLHTYIARNTNWQIGRGNREALASIISYIGFIIAFLAGGFFAGIDFSGLAIIAGALSVGIGFGLQNIVGNFVSGIILLIERPITQGDRIRVGETEGFITRISIRSTHIITLQKAEVIVPNSDLISKPVINYRIFDENYKIPIPVKVAYGSDLRLVETILYKVVKSHPKVVIDKDGLQPDVYFKSFGDNNLEFEINFLIKDINLRGRVVSDLNFSIEETFRAHHIEIPLPQQEIRVRNWPKKDLIQCKET